MAQNPTILCPLPSCRSIASCQCRRRSAFLVLAIAWFSECRDESDSGVQLTTARKAGDSLTLTTFDFLGFTHICGKTRRGDFTIHRKTSRKKFQAKLKAIKVELLRRMHADLAQVGKWLQSVYRGWCQYYAVPGNYARLRQFRNALQEIWLRVLRRRSQRGCRLIWAKFSALSRRWLPTPKILHPYPNVRFASQHPR